MEFHQLYLEVIAALRRELRHGQFAFVVVLEAQLLVENTDDDIARLRAGIDLRDTAADMVLPVTGRIIAFCSFYLGFDFRRKQS